MCDASSSCADRHSLIMGKEIRAWRCFGTPGQPGLHVWFDPRTEILILRDLTMAEKLATLDKPGSVSGSIRSDQAEISDGCDGPAPSGCRPSFMQLPLDLEES